MIEIEPDINLTTLLTNVTSDYVTTKSTTLISYLPSPDATPEATPEPEPHYSLLGITTSRQNTPKALNIQPLSDSGDLSDDDLSIAEP